MTADKIAGVAPVISSNLRLVREAVGRGLAGFFRISTAL